MTTVVMFLSIYIYNLFKLRFASIALGQSWSYWSRLFDKMVNTSGYAGCNLSNCPLVIRFAQKGFFAIFGICIFIVKHKDAFPFLLCCNRKRQRFSKWKPTHLLNTKNQNWNSLRNMKYLMNEYDYPIGLIEILLKTLKLNKPASVVFGHKINLTLKLFFLLLSLTFWF